MNPVTSPPPVSLELVLSRTRARTEQLFRRYNLSPQEAEHLLVGALPRLESLHGVLPAAGHRLLKRLESGCRQLRADCAPTHGAVQAGDYDDVLDRPLAQLRDRYRRSEQERRKCGTLVAELAAAQAKGEQLPEWTPSLEMLLELLDHARSLWGSDPARSLELARIAQETLVSRSCVRVRRRLMADLEARSHAYCGNSLRLLQDFRRAEQEFRAAQTALSRGTRDPRERAEVLARLATLRRDQRCFGDAQRLLQQTAAIYRWAGNRHLEGETFMQMATAQAYAGQPELAIPLGEQALQLLDRERVPRRFGGAMMNMVHYLAAAGRPLEARERLPEAHRFMAVHGTPKDLRGLKWMEGQIAVMLRQRDEGERLLLEVREEYIEVGKGYEAALVALELAAEYLDQGRSRDALRMAEETVPTFQSLEIHREILAALIALARAIELETANAGLVRELIQRLEDTRDGAPGRAEKPS